MNLIYTTTGRPARPGDVVKDSHDVRWVTIAGWLPFSLHVLAWVNPDDIGLLDKVSAYSPSFLGLEWKS